LGFVNKSCSNFRTQGEKVFMKSIYVGNLSYSVDEEALKKVFETYGEVKSAKVITDRETGRSKGFGFVEMESDESAKTAIDTLNGTDVAGRNVKVTEAEPRKPREQRSFQKRDDYQDSSSYNSRYNSKY